MGHTNAATFKKAKGKMNGAAIASAGSKRKAEAGAPRAKRTRPSPVEALMEAGKAAREAAPATDTLKRSDLIEYAEQHTVPAPAEKPADAAESIEATQVALASAELTDGAADPVSEGVGSDRVTSPEIFPVPAIAPDTSVGREAFLALVHTVNALELAFQWAVAAIKKGIA